ncbi:hypothetical protein PF66_02322 [Pseudomonas asplenii]|uniref:Uncharacterized protein n=1 Tax=Pseudomonas asplenii TaxID=53407 RepID=A0A0N0E4L8_9PSED|nr:hypothetical protein [Pseudomonas fuscovaginae]KPA91439.1 hypothetical protein PF66_02322 [Pseudomonas fuscovaginae]
MYRRGPVYNAWVQQPMTEVCHNEAVENGCYLDIRVRARSNEVLELLVCVYSNDLQPVWERVETLSATEWTLADALQRGRDQAERIAGGEAGRLSCADSGQPDNA